MQTDAIRCKIQVATSRADTVIVGTNNNGLYAVDEVAIDSYITANGLASFSDQKAAIAGQIWIYSYNCPQRMWDWWRMTDYPKFVTVDTPAQLDQGRLPYFISPITRVGGTALEFPRRNVLPTPNVANQVNFKSAEVSLLALPNFGGTMGTTTGRIFWDRAGM